MRAASPSGLSILLHRETYTIAGSRLDHLRRAVLLLGPRRAGLAHPAFTDWHVRWSYAPEHGAVGTRVSDPQVVAKVTCTLPTWRPPPTAPADLVSRWATYLEALERHEQGHIDLGGAAAAAVYETLRTLPPCTTAEALQAAAKAAVGAALEDMRARERAYDAATAHGAAQGVLLDDVQRG